MTHVEKFYKRWWSAKQMKRPEPMRKPFGHYMNDKYDFAAAYAREVLEQNPWYQLSEKVRENFLKSRNKKV